MQAQNSTILSSAIALARIYEGKTRDGKKGPNDFRPNLFSNKSPSQGTRVTEGDDKKGNTGEIPMRHFAPAEL